jgi:hypothetical protein
MRHAFGAAWAAVLTVAVACAALAVLAHVVGAAEDTPPTIEMTYPTTGAVLGASLQVRGVAHDAEGFNMSSYVVLWWDDWGEMFKASSTPADNGFALAYGEIIDLTKFQPGPHNLYARAFDGLLWSVELNVSVTLRDLADLVVFPPDISLDPRDVEGGQRAHVVVVVHNTGGEDATDVVVRALRNGTLIGERTVPRVGARGNVTVRIPWEAQEGEVYVTVTVEGPAGLQERSTQNNDATEAFDVPEESAFKVGFWFYLAVGSLASAAIVTGAYSRSRRREPDGATALAGARSPAPGGSDPPRNH